MGNKLFVGNLPYTINDESLAEFFSQGGNVESAKVIVDRTSGRSKGFGFVEMSTDEEAADAISKLNGSELEGRAIKVDAAQPKAPRDRD
jgi:RNA recognition motif-containing protein